MASLDAIRLLTALSKTEGAPSESGFQAWRRTLEEALTEVQLADWIYYKVVNKGIAPARVLDVKKTFESYSKRMQSVPKDVFAALDNVWISGHPVSKEEKNAAVEAASFAFAVYKAALFHDVHPAGMLSAESLWEDDVDGGCKYVVKGSPFDLIEEDYKYA